MPVGKTWVSRCESFQTFHGTTSLPVGGVRSWAARLRKRLETGATDLSFTHPCCLRVDMWGQQVYQGPVAAVTNHHTRHGLETTGADFLAVLEARCLKSRCGEGHSLSEVSREDVSVPLAAAGGSSLPSLVTLTPASASVTVTGCLKSPPAFLV